MNKQRNNRLIVRSEQTNHSLQVLMNNILMIDFNYPVYQIEPSKIEEQNQKQQEFKLIKNLGNVQGLISTLKFLKLRDKHIPNIQSISQSKIETVSSIIFCRPVKHNLKDEKVFWLMKNKIKKALNLDNPKGLLVLPNNFLITVERKYINLYQIQQNLTINLKDFDSNGLGKKFAFCEIKNVNYKNKQYILIFGNEKYHFKDIFLVLIFEVSRGRLRFIKKATIAEKQVISPTIIFENDPNSKQQQKFCLVVGGCCENFQTIHYSALKIHLHILLNQYLFYGMDNTLTIPFSNKKGIILSGKAINFRQAWYFFCSQQQTINQITLQYGGPAKALTKIDIKSEKLNLKQKILFNQNSMHYIYEFQQDKIVFIDKNLDLRQKSLNDLIYKLKQ